MKFPMLLEVDNKGTVDLINNWSVGGRTKNSEKRQLFLSEIREKFLPVNLDKW